MLQGIDCSNNQGTIDWGRVKAAGSQFAFLKRSEGIGFADDTFDLNWVGAASQNMARGAYHFARPGINTPQAEAAYFLSLLPPLEPGDMVVLDIEEDGTEDRSAWALAWLRAVAAALHFPPLLYSYPDYINRCLTDPVLGTYPLWLASYSAVLPNGIGPWGSIAIWQYSDAGVIPGIDGKVDLNKLDRTLDGLKALGKPAPHPVAETGAYHVVTPGSLKTEPNHGSTSAIDPRKKPIYLEAGAKLILTGKTAVDPSTHQTWVECRLTGGEAAVHGYFLRAGLAVG